MYLDGEFGSDPDTVGPHAASTFFAVDRYASYKTVWGKAYARGETVLTDRYTTSNAIHQGSKLRGAERETFFHWLDEFEHQKMELPRPDIVLFMDVPIEIALENIRSRGSVSDIHEAGADYLRTCAEAAKDAAEFYGWYSVLCTEDAKMRPEHEIHRDILDILKVARLV